MGDRFVTRYEHGNGLAFKSFVIFEYKKLKEILKRGINF